MPRTCLTVWLLMVIFLFAAVGLSQPPPEQPFCSDRVNSCPPTVNFQTAGSGYSTATINGHHYLYVSMAASHLGYKICPGHVPYCCYTDCGIGSLSNCGSGSIEEEINSFLYWPDCFGEPETVEGTYSVDGPTYSCGSVLNAEHYEYQWVWRFDTTGCGPGLVPTYNPDATNLNPPPWDKGEFSVAVGMRPKPGSKALDSLHAFGDELCYEFHVLAPLDVRALLKTSTYEGRAMNCPVNAGQSPSEEDTISDLVPATAGGWDLVSRTFHDDRRWFLMKQIFRRPGFYDLCVRVLDYAAEGDLTAYQAESELYELCCTQEIPPSYARWKSQADPDSDGFTVWEEYRGFCDSTEGAHFRLDIDTVASKTKRQIIVVDNDDVLSTTYVAGFKPRLQEMMKCSLIVDCNILTYTVEGSESDLTWEVFERLDAYNGKWDASTDDWVSNPLTDPLYLHPSPVDSSDLVRSADQVAVRISWQDLSQVFNGRGFGAYGLTCHINRVATDWDYGICSNEGIGIDTVLIWNDLHGQWSPERYGTGGGLQAWFALEHQVIEVARCRNIAHEFGHAIAIDEHSSSYGSDEMCPLYNDIVWVNDQFPQSLEYSDFSSLGEDARYAWWANNYVLRFKDDPDAESDAVRWGYKADTDNCKHRIFYRPPFRSPNP